MIPRSALDPLITLRDYLWTRQPTDWLTLVVFGALVALLLLIAMRSAVGRWMQREVRNPRRLFREVAVRLRLTVVQRDLLRRMVRDLRLEHPTLIMLSPQLFRLHANRWMSQQRQANLATSQRLDELSAALFPTRLPVDPRPGVAGPPTGPEPSTTK